jgi:basic membrane protein A
MQLRSTLRPFTGPGACAVLVALAVVLLTSACGEERESEPATTAAGSTVASPSLGDDTLEREIHVGLVTNARLPNANTLDALARKGLQDAVAELDVIASAAEASTTAEYEQQLETMARQGYDLIVAVGGSAAAVTREVAGRYPESAFAVLDYEYPEKDRLPNLSSLIFNERESGYLAGYVAGMVTRSGVAYAVGLEDDAGTALYLRGFREGFERAYPGGEVASSSVPVSASADGCAESAFAAEQAGADVLFAIAPNCADDLLRAAEERGLYGIGADVDRSYVGSGVLTSTIKRADVVVVDAIHAVAQGVVEDVVGTMSPYRLRVGDTTVYGLSYGGIDLAPVSPEVDSGVLAKLDEVIDELREGELELPRVLVTGA